MLDQPYICHEGSPVFYGPWIQELKSLNIDISYSSGQGPIELLLGADVSGLLYTVKRHLLKCWLFSYETYVDWTVKGKVMTQSNDMLITSLTKLFYNRALAT